MSKKPGIIFNSAILPGLLLIISFFLAICAANIDALADLYKNLVFFPISFGCGHFVYHCSLINLVNDGFMTLFFLLIGLELKFHLVCGEYQAPKKLILPTMAAIGGVIIPSLIYWKFNFNTSNMIGWAIPIATDTAFMLGILSFFAKVITPGLRAFIIGFSLIDDALALSILAIFYTRSSSVLSIVIAAIMIILLIVLNRYKVKSSVYYLVVGIFLWVAMIKSGIHGTLCGVIVALAIPVQIKEKLNSSFQQLEKFLKPLVYYLILPVFAFLNSGINFDNFSYKVLTSNITLGVMLGLFIGKQLGIFFFSYGAVKLKWCNLPNNMSWVKFYAIAVLGGLGFTLSLFIGDLSFEADAPNYAMRAGVIIGSLLSVCCSTAILIYLSRRKKG